MPTAVEIDATGTSGVRSSILFGNAADLAGSTTVQYSNTEHGTHPGAGNLSTDPLFHAPAAGDYRLRFASPCTDSASPSEPCGLDLTGVVRPVDGDLNTEQRADMGAHEFAPLVLAGEPAVGTNVQLELWGPAGGSAIVLWKRGTPAPPIATPFGTYELGLPRRSFATSATAPGPPIPLPLPIPTDPTLVGSRFPFRASSTARRRPSRPWR